MEGFRNFWFVPKLVFPSNVKSSEGKKPSEGKLELAEDDSTMCFQFCQKK